MSVAEDTESGKTSQLEGIALQHGLSDDEKQLFYKHAASSTAVRSLTTLLKSDQAVLLSTVEQQEMREDLERYKHKEEETFTQIMGIGGNLLRATKDYLMAEILAAEKRMHSQ